MNQTMAEKFDALRAALQANADLQSSLIVLDDLQADVEATDRRWSERLRRADVVIENISDGVVLTDSQGRVIDWNPGAEHIFGYPRSDVLGRTLSFLRVPGFENDLMAKMMGDFAGAQTWRGEFRFRRADESEGVCESVVVPFLDSAGKTAARIGFHHEITQHKQAQEQERIEFLNDVLEMRVEERTEELRATVERLRASEGELRSLSRQILTVEESERRRLAQEVHDELGHRLAVLKVSVALLRDASADEAVTMLGEMDGSIDEAVDVMRRVSSELRPRLLDELGLEPTLEWQLGAFQKKTGIECHLEADVKGDIEPDLATALFRVLQEALTNVARHSEAGRVTVTLSQESNMIRMEVEDNGLGISDSEEPRATSLGLLGMKERLMPWKGTVRMASMGEGAQLLVEAMLSEESSVW